MFNRGIAWPRGSGEAALALCIALGVMLGLGYWAPGAFRDLETASLDLRFRLRGMRSPGPEREPFALKRGPEIYWTRPFRRASSKGTRAV